MDTPPSDHGSDRYDYVEVEAPPGIRPIGEWWDMFIEKPCPDCRANVFATFIATSADEAWRPTAWQIDIAHDDGCPFLARVEGLQRDD